MPCNRARPFGLWLAFVAIPLVAGFDGQAMESFDACLKTIPKCAKAFPKATVANDSDLNAFLQSVTAPIEAKKKKCVLKNSPSGAIREVCAKAIAHYDFHVACNDDIRAKCTDQKPGHGAIHECLRSRFDELNPKCRDALRKIDESGSPPPGAGCALPGSSDRGCSC